MRIMGGVGPPFGPWHVRNGQSPAITILPPSGKRRLGRRGGVWRQTYAGMVVGRLSARHFSLANGRPAYSRSVVFARSTGDLRVGPFPRSSAAGPDLPQRQVLRDGRRRFFGRNSRLCNCRRQRRGQTWLTPPMIRAYSQLFAMGHCHSVEVWHDRRLAGGTYGLAIGGLFAAESMFYQVRDASKVALVCLVQRLRRQGYVLMDIQQLTPHTAQFGAIEIPRAEYLRRLAEALCVSASFGNHGEETLQSATP